MASVVLLLSLLWSVVYCQTFPYISVGGEPAIDNNSYVENYSTFTRSSGSPGGGYVDYKTFRCQTNLRTCCGHDYSHHGDWYFPNGTVIESDYGDARSYQGEQAVYLRQDYSSDYYYTSSSTSPPSGIYCCRIPTEDMHNDRDISVRDTVCVGLYDTGKCSLLDVVWHSHTHSVNTERVWPASYHRVGPCTQNSGYPIRLQESQL